MTATATTTILPTEADDAATINGWSDRKAATIIKRTAKSITVREDSARLLNGATSGEADALTFTAGGFLGHTSGAQRWEVTADEDGITSTYTLRGNGRWVRSGQPANSRSSLTIGRRAPHYDFNF
jgi:hypothetical protein